MAEKKDFVVTSRVDKETYEYIKWLKELYPYGATVSAVISSELRFRMVNDKRYYGDLESEIF